MTEKNPLQKLADFGQSVWLDYISRDLLQSGQLQQMVENENVTGLTSNPTIFQKAISEGNQYDAQIKEVLAAGVTDPGEVFLHLAITDIQHAADILRPVFEKTGGADGFVSLEVFPGLAHDTDGTVAMVRSFWERVQRPNLMVKIPATKEGIPAIARALGEGMNINITLIFSLQFYDQVINAYLQALENRHRTGRSVDIHSVASFFVSRVDTAVDKLLDEILAREPSNELAASLLGKAAIANARLAYEKFERNFRSGERFAILRPAGAFLQRPLWASTSAKNPKYRDVVYAEALIGPDTVDTMPPATVEAFRDHGIVAGNTVDTDYAGARQTMKQLQELGIDMEEVTQGLLDAGVKSFADSFDELLQGIADKIEHLKVGSGRHRLMEWRGGEAPGADQLAAGMTDRIWRRDAGLWKPGSADHQKIIANRLGWLDVIGAMQTDIPRLDKLAAATGNGQLHDCVLLGMGGSSLCPEVLRETFGSSTGHPQFHVLDTTDPAAISHLTATLNPQNTLFIVASKSGGTIETLSHFAHFWEWMQKAAVTEPGNHFIAITDSGTPLQALAEEHGFREIFLNPSDIGGRYSALSYFGMVPAAVMGLDYKSLLERGAAMRQQCLASTAAEANGGLQLGIQMGRMQKLHRDKLTILTGAELHSFGLWAEQLIAESTGKEGTGIIPISEEPLGEPQLYANDRFFVALKSGETSPGFANQIQALIEAGQPVFTIELSDAYDLGAEFFRFEFATAVAGALLGIDPFDEPNVQESKDNTKRVLASYESSGRLSSNPVAVSEDGIDLIGPATSSLEAGLHAHLQEIQAGDYVALMAYAEPTEENFGVLQEFRLAIRQQYRVATTLGFGPRFLHSTGQLHKGGPNTGVFIQITVDDAEDVGIPGQAYSFSILKSAQADGDLQSLQAHERRVIRLHIHGDFKTALARLKNLILPATLGVG